MNNNENSAVLLLIEDTSWPPKWNTHLTGLFDRLLWGIHLKNMKIYLPEILMKDTVTRNIQQNLISLKDFYQNDDEKICRRIRSSTINIAINCQKDREDSSEKFILDRLNLPRIDYVISYITDGSDEEIIRDAVCEDKRVFNWYKHSEIDAFINELENSK